MSLACSISSSITVSTMIAGLGEVGHLFGECVQGAGAQPVSREQRHHDCN